MKVARSVLRGLPLGNWGRLLDKVSADIAQLSASEQLILGPKALEDLELNLRRLTTKQSDLIAAKLLQKSLLSAESKDEAKKILDCVPHKMKNYGPRIVKISMGGGTTVKLVSSYYARPCNEKKSVMLDYSQV